MTNGTAIEWTHRPGTKGETWNPTTGCDRISAGCDNCLAPETRVLKADMTWVPIGTLKVGDRLVSFTETPAIGQNRVWEEATVEAVWETEQPTVEIELANGVKFTASEDHKWLLAKRGASTWWRETIGLNFKTELRTVRCEPTSTDSVDYQAGYVAGVTAGDGTFRWDPEWRSSSMGYPQTYWRVAKLADDRAVLDRLVKYLGAIGIEVAVRNYDGGQSKFTDDPRPLAKVETRRLQNMPIIAALCEERPSREWMAGYLAGMFDTDASYSGGSLRYCQSKPNDVLDRVVRYGKELGFEFRLEEYEDTCPTARLVGGIPECIAFLSAISPALERRCRDFYGKRTETNDVAVTGIRRGPVKKLVDITTSTGTFIAEGALTHNCYALTMARRLKGMGSAKYQNDGDPRTSGPGFGITEHLDAVNQPRNWASPRTIFVNSMSDLFHHGVSDGFIGSVWDTMAAADRHRYLILTKRPARARGVLSKWADAGGYWRRADMAWCGPFPEPLPQVELGTSIESDEHVGRAHHLRETPAATRFLSLEPLLGPLPSLNLGGIDQVIIGGESGHGARPMDLGWVRELIGMARDAGTAVFVKQLGTRWAGSGKGGNWDLWPEDLRIREFPQAVAA